MLAYASKTLRARHLHVRGADARSGDGAHGHDCRAPPRPARGDRARRSGRPRRLRGGRAPPARLRRVGARGGARRGGGANEPDPAHERRLRPELGRPDPRVPGLRDARPALGRPRRDHGRTRLVHRVLPALRARPARLRRPVRREARPAPRRARARARHLVGRASRAARRPGCLSAASAGAAARLGRRGRHAGVGGARGRSRPAARARDHRRAPGALRSVRGAPSPRGARSRARASGAQHQLARVRRGHRRGGVGDLVRAVRDDDGPDRAGAGLAPDDASSRSRPRDPCAGRTSSAARAISSRRSSSSTRSSVTSGSCSSSRSGRSRTTR